VSRSRSTSGGQASGAPRKKGGGWLIGLLVVALVAGGIVGLGIYLLHRLGGLPLFSTTQCTAVDGSTSFTYDLEQMQNASTIAAVGMKLGVPTYGIEIAEATALQESKLYNLSGGDRDSLGLFQQRPSMGWGSADQIMDTTYSSTAFYQALLKVSDWQSLPLTVAAQDVQHSGYPTAYAGHQQEAQVLAAVFTGTVGGGLTCTLDGPTFSPQATNGQGLTTQGQAVVADAQKQWGTATIEDASAGARTFALALPDGLAGPARLARGWAYANWAVSKAEALGITQVGYDGKTWSASNSPGSWQASSDSSAAPTDRVVLTMTSGS
jgi:hypothetical protein